MIRPARAEDRGAVEAIVEAAHSVYTARIGKPPGPMLDDYAKRIAEGVVSVLGETDGTTVGLIVLFTCCSTISPCDPADSAAASDGS